MMKKLNYKDYNKRVTTRDNGNVQSHDKKESKSNSTISANSGAHNLTHDQIIKKSPFNKINIATFKTNKILTRSYYYDLSNRCNGAEVMFLSKDGLSPISNRLSFNSRKNLLFSHVRILKSS